MRVILASIAQAAIRFRADERGAVASDLAKAAVAIAFLSVIAANIMSNRIEANEKAVMASIAGEAAKGRLVDSSATGSLARSVNQTKVDPCALPPRR